MKMRRLLMLMLGVFVLSAQLLAQNRTVSGSVTDSTGQPLPQVSIFVSGTKTGTLSDYNGSFSLSVPQDARTLEVSYVGFETKRVNIPASGPLTIVLSSTVQNNTLNEVVVTGYTREKRSNFAGAVSKVSAKEVNQIPVASLDQILQGRAPGLYVTAGSGQPGAAATVIIRGVGTINGSSTPLYVVDGVPVQAGAFSALNASDIESVDILKDASATALYGSRGSNGVIVVTTKRGRTGSKVVFGVRTQAGVAKRVSPTFEMMNSQQRMQYEEEVGLESGLNIGPGWTYSRKNPANAGLSESQLQSYDAIRDSLGGMNVDWRDIFFRTGTFQEHELNASGGSDKVSFYSSLNYYKQKGVALRSSLERYSLRNNVDFKSDRFVAALSSTINYAQSSFIENENTTSVTNPFASVYYALPYEQPYIDGVLVHSGNDDDYDVLDLREGSTALERLLATTSKRNELKGVLGGNFRFKVTNDLSLISTLGLDFRELMTERFIDPNSYTGTLVSGEKGSFGESTNRFHRLFGNAGAHFNKRIGDVHTVDVTALYEGIKSNSRTYNYTGYGINPLLPGTPAGITPGSADGFIPVVGGGRDVTALQSFIAIAKYSFDDKYSLNASYRLDGSSSVPKENRWHPFYSVGATWNLFKENFMQGVSFVNDLKLRASYGETASPFSSSFGYLSTYGNAKYDGATGVAPTQIGNPAYDWEYAKAVNIGVDFALFKRRVNASIDVYNKNTENLFIDQELSRTSGATALEINAGKMRNRGIELDLSADAIATRDFRWTVGANVAYNENEITDLGQVNEFEQGTSIIRVGLPYGSHYMVKWAGVDQATGQALYYNRDGSVTTDFNTTTQSVAEFGSYLPKVQGGFNTSLSYKGLYLEAFFSFAAGNKRFNNEDYFNEAPGFATSNQSTRMLDRWKKPGDVTDIQKFGTKRNFSSKDIQDASYVRFRNLNVGYNVPKHLLNKVTEKISAVSLFVQGQNLHTWTNWRGFDPEDNNNISTFEYPSSKVVTVGLNVNF